MNLSPMLKLYSGIGWNPIDNLIQFPYTRINQCPLWFLSVLGHLSIKEANHE